MSEHTVEKGLRRRKVRPIHRLKFWWKTRHWNRAHGPGCPARYGDGECFDIGIGWCVTPPEGTNDD